MATEAPAYIPSLSSTKEKWNAIKSESGISLTRLTEKAIPLLRASLDLPVDGAGDMAPSTPAKKKNTRTRPKNQGVKKTRKSKGGKR